MLLLVKRLFAGNRFQWPRTPDEARELTAEQFRRLTCPLCGHPVREYDKAYYCVNKDCGFRKIYKAVKGFHPTLHSDTMRELLANGSAVTDKGTYSIIDKEPYIAFEYANKPAADDSAPDQVLQLVKDSGFEYVDKRASGGSLWIVAGEAEGKELAERCRKLGVSFAFTAKCGRASKKRPAWYSVHNK